MEVLWCFPLRADDGITYTDNKSKANILNKQFKSVFKNEKDTVLPNIGSSNTPGMTPIKVDSAGVLKILKNIDVHKASGPDEIPPRLLKDHANLLAPVLTRLFQYSLDQGVIPLDWSKANVASLFKKGDRANPSNYQPISLTCITCKY